jgi:tetratricopeptide (TPR) repeat protein/transcriptional regulator with XRE-family HTH domain
MTIIDSDLASFGDLLKGFRTRRHLTQHQLACALGVHRNAISRWEQGDVLPAHKAVVLELTRHLKLDDQETRQLLEASLTALPPHWSVPFPRNPYFTGREKVLEALHTQLGIDQAVALTQSSALHGLGGVGKTQIALEYAYRYALEYSAVFWVRAETEESIVFSLLRIAEVLQLPGRDDKDQQHVVAAVQRWLSTHGQWLVTWDNVEDLDILNRFLPSTRSGAILLTTRLQALGTLARGLDLAPMEHEEGTLFLLRRGKVLDTEASDEQVGQFARQMPAQYAAATELMEVLGGLPLALDQAGAYVEETHCGLPAYLDLFRTRRATLLQLRGEGTRDHPASVVTTFTLALRATAERHPVVLDLLLMCALLQPDAIPEEVFRQGGKHLGPQLQAVCCDALKWDHVVSLACAYSLLSRQPEEQTLSIHRLVQSVLVDGMSETEQVQWSRRVIEVLDAVFPEIQPTTESTAWKQGERLLPHALLCLQRARANEESLPLASLAYKVARYLRERGQYGEAESLLQRALQIREQTFGAKHLEVTSCLDELAILSFRQGKYEQAELLYQRTLHIWEQTLGPEDLKVAKPLYGLARLHLRQGKYEQAGLLYRRALQVWERVLGPWHPEVAKTLDGLALLHSKQGKYEQAESLFQRALQIWEQALGPEHSEIAYPLNNLANLYRSQGKYEQAEPLYEHALRLREQHLGRNHPEVAQTLHDLAILWQKQGDLVKAQAQAEHALQIHVQALGEAHPETIATRALYAQLIQEQAGGTEPTLEHIRTFLKARGWSVHLKKRRDKLYVYATRRVGEHTHSRYLAPLSNLAACLAAVWMLPNAKEEKPTVAQ